MILTFGSPGIAVVSALAMGPHLGVGGELRPPPNVTTLMGNPIEPDILLTLI